MSRIFSVISILFLLVFTSCSTEYSRILKSKDDERKLKMADKYYAEKKYAHAQELYEAEFSYLRGKPAYEDARYRFAYTAYYLKDYEQGGLAFQTFMQDFPNSDRVAEAFYMEGYCLYRNSPKVELDQSSTLKAIATLQSFINTYPNDEHVDGAKKLIDTCNFKLEQKEYLAAQLYYNTGYFKSAHIYFDLLMSDYPNSPKAEEYMYKTVLSSYQYAKKSVEYLQIDRYQAAIDECENFISQYANSKYLPRINSMRKDSENELTRLKQIQTKLQNEQIKKAS